MLSKLEQNLTGERRLTFSAFGAVLLTSIMTLVNTPPANGNSDCCESEAFAIDNRDGVGLRITAVEPTYEGVFVAGIEIINSIQVTVDWDTATPGSVVFELNDSPTTVPTSSDSAQLSYSMGSDLVYNRSGQLNTLTLYAKAADGEVSPSVSKSFYGLALPEWAISLETKKDLGFRVEPLTGRLTLYGEVEVFDAGVEGTVAIPKSIPEIGGRWGVDVNPLIFAWELSAQPRFGTGAGITGLFDLGGNWGATARAGTKREGAISATLSGAGEFYPEFKLADVSVELAGSFAFLFRRVPLLCQWTGCCHTGFCPYFQASIKPVISGMVGMEEGEPAIVAGLKFKNGTVNINATLAGTVGAGSEGSIYYIAGTIGGKPFIVLQFPGDPNSSCLNDYVQEVGFDLEARYVIESAWWKREQVWTFNLYTCPESGLQYLMGEPVLPGDVEVVQREYLAARGGYCVFSEQVNDGGQRAIPGLPAPILNVGTGPLPNVAATSDRGLLTFVYDDASKPTGEHQEIYFARWDGGAWTAHAPLTSNNQPDIQPVAAIDSNGTELAVWVQGGQPTGFETGPRDILPKFEIAYSSFDSNGGMWSVPQRVTSNGYADMLPWFDDSGPLRACWIASTTNGIPVWHDEEIEPSIDLMAAEWDGASFGGAYTLAAGLSAVSPPAVVRSVSHEFLAYIEDLDANSGTTDDREVVVRSRLLGGGWSSDVPLTSDLESDVAVQMAMDVNGLPLVAWVKRMVSVPVPGEDDTHVDQLWFATWNGASWSTATLAFETEGIKEPNLIRNAAGKLVLFWVAASEEFSDIYYSVHDADLDLWGEPQQITHDTGAETMVSMSLSGGNVLVGYVKRRVDLATTNGLPEIGMSDIYLLEHAPTRDLVVSSNGFTFEPDPVVPGESHTVCIDVLVTGDFTVEDVAVEFYEGAIGTNGALIGTDTIDRLLPGETQPACFTWNVPTNGIERTRFAVVDPANTIPETEEFENNIASISVFKPDLRISAPTVTGYPGADTVLIGCSVRNDGSALAGESKLEVRRDDASGAVVFSMDVPAVAGSSAAVVQFAWDVSAITDGIYELHLATDVDEGVTEVNELNNVSTIGVPVLGDLRAEQWSGVYDAGTSGVVIRNVGAKPIAASVVRATMNSMNVGEAPEPALIAGESATISIPITQAVPAGWLSLTVNPDSDGGDEVTLLNNTATAVVNASGDWDGDGELDLDDFAGFAECMAGPEVSPNPMLPATTNECLAAFDFEADNDVDLADFSAFGSGFSP